MHLQIWNYFCRKIIELCPQATSLCRNALTDANMHNYILWKNATYDINWHVRYLVILDLFFFFSFSSFHSKSVKKVCYIFVCDSCSTVWRNPETNIVPKLRRVNWNSFSSLTQFGLTHLTIFPAKKIQQKLTLLESTFIGS